MSVVTLTINGQMVPARPEETLLEVAREAGFPLPTLCHQEGLSSPASCRMCVVEIEGVARPQPACITRAKEGMVFTTHSPKLLEYRKMLLELLLAEGNHTCSVCVANGHCELQDLSALCGVDHVRFPYLYPSRGIDLSHELFGMDANRCILCTRCIRVCDEVEAAHTWDLAGRGQTTRVISDMHQDWGDSNSCTSCGKCVVSCPTGALFRKGASVAEMEKDRSKLVRVLDRRNQRET